jgi:UDP-3-O-[3-hydroxymyristoyl] glucosamine N-acyltransferase
VTTATLAAIARLVGGTVEGDPTVTIAGAASIGRSQAGDITLADSPRLAKQLAQCRASAVVVCQGFPATAIPRIVVADVHAAFAQIVLYFRPQHESLCPGCSPCASVAPSAKLAADASVHPFATIGDEVVIQSGAVIH